MNIDDKLEVTVMDMTIIRICATNITEQIRSLQHTLSVLGISHVHTDDAIDRIYSNSLEIEDMCKDLIGEDTQ